MPTHLLSKTSLFILIILVGIQVLIANQLSTAGIKLTQFQQQIANLQQQNHQLDQQIQNQTSLRHLAEQAQLRGYFFTPKTLAINGHEPIAMKPINNN